MQQRLIEVQQKQEEILQRVIRKLRKTGKTDEEMLKQID